MNQSESFNLKICSLCRIYFAENIFEIPTDFLNQITHSTTDARAKRVIHVWSILEETHFTLIQVNQEISKLFTLCVSSASNLENAPTNQSACKLNFCLLSTVRDWQLRVGIRKRSKVPEQIAATTLRPDLILLSTVTWQVVLMELTVPWEENIDMAFERKLEKCQVLVEQCRSSQWRTACYPIEVGCRGFAGRSLCKTLSRLDMINGKKKAIRAISESAEKPSRMLRIKRADLRSTTETCER